MITFHKKYFSLFVLIFITEVLIALFVHDGFVRPYLGDVLVVILIYCFIRSFLNVPVLATAIFVLLFSFTIEFLQYIRIVKKLGLKSEILRTVLGTSFAWADIFAYIAGIVIVLAVDKYAVRKPAT